MITRSGGFYHGSEVWGRKLFPRRTVYGCHEMFDDGVNG